jgi:aminoglycoside phosphotransferase (APT) family kinase protein
LTPQRLQVGRWDARGLAAQLGATSVQRLRRQAGSANAHYRLAHPDESAWFLKVYVTEDHGLRERVALQALDHAQRPSLLAYGEHDGRLWAALPWVDLTRVPLTSPEAAAQLAEAAADIHRIRPLAGDGLPAIGEVMGTLGRGLELVAELDQPVAARISAIFEPVRADAAMYAARFEAACLPGLLQGDCQSRNLFRAPDGPPFLIDFERAGIGPPEYDLVWSWYTEVSRPALRSAFLERYRAGVDFGREVPDRRYLWLVGLMFVTGAIRYTHRVRAPGLRRYALRILSACEAEAGELW